MGVFTFWRLFSYDATLFLGKEKGDLSGEIRVLRTGRICSLIVLQISNPKPKAAFCTVCCELEEYMFLFCFGG